MTLCLMLTAVYDVDPVFAGDGYDPVSDVDPVSDIDSCAHG